MYAAEIHEGRPPKPLTYRLSDVPHGTVETNRTCNLCCRACYNLDRTSVKSVDDIQREIDLLLKKRNVQVVTILGGEPTLHPNLAEVVAFIKKRGRICQLLTNGIRLLEDGGDRLLDDLKSAGIDKIIVHIDIGQRHFYPDIEAARRALFSKLEGHGILFSLSVTIYKETSGTISGELEKYASFRYFDGVLGVLARDGLPVNEDHPRLRDEYLGLKRDLALEPAAYIPFYPNERRVGWLIYFMIRNTETNRVVPVSPEIYRFFGRMYRLARGREFFAPLIGPRWTKVVAFAAMAADVVRHPPKAKTFWRLSRRSSRLKALRVHYVAIQNPPEIDPETRQYQICHNCPDATIRNGLLTPICIADKINPMQTEAGAASPDSELYRIAYGHLNEIRAE
jgi:hypothetical protein